jgi:hypothetical protein
LAPAPPAIREGAPRRRVDCGETILQNSPCDPNIYIKPPDLDRDYSPRSKYLHVDPGPWQPFPSTAARCATWTWRITATDGGFHLPPSPPAVQHARNAWWFHVRLRHGYYQEAPVVRDCSGVFNFLVLASLAHEPARGQPKSSSTHTTLLFDSFSPLSQVEFIFVFDMVQSEIW